MSMKKMLILISFLISAISLNAYYFNNRFLQKYSINKPYFEGSTEFGGDKTAIEKLGVYASHLITGELSLDDLNTPIIQMYSHIGFSDNLYGGKFYSYNRGISKPYNDIDLKLERKIYQLNFYQHNKIYNKIYSGLIAKIFYQEYKFKEDKSLIKELLEDEYTEKTKSYGFDFWWGIKYSLENFVFAIKIGPEAKFSTFNNSNDVNEKYNVVIGTFNAKINYNLAFTIFLQPMYITLSAFYNKNYFEEYYGGGFNWKINKYFSFEAEGSNSRYIGIFNITPFSFFSFNMKIENSAIKYKTRYKYIIDERDTAFFAGITLKFQSLGMPSFRNK